MLNDHQDDEDLYRRRFPPKRLFGRSTADDIALCAEIADRVINGRPMPREFRDLQAVVAEINLEQRGRPARKVPRKSVLIRMLARRQSGIRKDHGNA